MLSRFWKLSKAFSQPRCLEVGTKRQGETIVSKKTRFLHIHPSGSFTGIDASVGEDVDVVADVQELYRHFQSASFHLAMCCSTLEHIRRPWLAAVELARVLKPSGLLYVQSHQTFPVHNYPQDYYRFSREALVDMFSGLGGLALVECGYQFPCLVMPIENYFPHARDWNFEAEAWLNVEGIFRKL